MKRLSHLSAALCLIFATAATATANADDLADLQREYTAVEIVHGAMQDSQQHIDAQLRSITAYLNANDMMKAYDASDAPSDDHLSGFPLSYDDALKSAEKEVGTAEGDTPPSTIQDADQLQRLISATKTFDEAAWDRLHPEAMQLAHMIAFVKASDKWDDMSDWVSTQQQAREQAVASATATKFQSAHDEALKEDEAGRQRVAKANEQAWQQTLQRQQEQWEHHMAEYDAETRRVQADHTYYTQPNYGYNYWRGGPYWRHDGFHRNTGRLYDN
ncbi:MAG: hypothetical protein AAGK09_13755 [Planctomycetota bacterium]